MIEPEGLDENNHLDQLSDDDKDRFFSEYETQYNDLDHEESIRAAMSEFSTVEKSRYRLFKAVKDGFHVGNSEGWESEYEVSFTNPLYEKKENPADLLLTYKDRTKVNFCFVLCEPVGEEHWSWNDKVNEVYDLAVGHEKYLLEQVEGGDREVRTVQFATVTHKEELRDVNFQHVEQQVAPDEYSLWVVDTDTPESIKNDRELRCESGKIAHKKLRDVLESGFDYSKSKYRGAVFSLKTHELICLKETFMSLMTAQHGLKEEPREFYKSDFEEQFIDLCEVGPSGADKEEILRNRANSLLETAKEAEIVYYGNTKRINERDYRLRYPNERGTSGVKDSIEKKYFEYDGPRKRSQLAFTSALDSFQPIDPIEPDLEHDFGSGSDWP